MSEIPDELIIAALREGFIYHTPNGKNVVADNEATRRLMACAADRLEQLLSHSRTPSPTQLPQEATVSEGEG